MSLKIGEAAALAKVSIRTLHHYDHIGLLEPVGRTESGYRLYSREDLEKLQQILFYRMLEFPLEKIQNIMNDPSFDRISALREQQQLLEARAEQTASLLALIRKTLDGEDMIMEYREMFEAFPELDPATLKEAEQDWGNTPQWQEQKERIAGYGAEDWQKIRAEVDAINQRLESVFMDGARPESASAVNAVEQARLHIDRWYYSCPHDLHAAIMKMTASDERYLARIEENCNGLAAWIARAASANAAEKTGND